MSRFSVDTSEMKAFFNSLEKAAKGEFRRELESYLDSIGYEFLRILQDVYVEKRKERAAQGINSADGNLLASFHKNEEGNVWNLLDEDDGLSLEVGTNVQYAEHVNYGHRTIDPAKPETYFFLPNGEMARFVPGKWNGKHFEYDPSSDEGMVLKQQDVEGMHFWEPSIAAIEAIINVSLDRKLQEWIDAYFGG